MKTIVMIIGMAIATIGFGYAQEDQKQMTRIDQIELPLGAQEDFVTGEFSDWEVVEAFEIPEQARENNEAYEVIAKKEGLLQTLFYDEEGNLIRQETKEN
ncbi:MAG: hypothetical protein M3Q58_09075 [Bacteroidota bacterium]|nr:hypothetical protein [Bacteroidota bacterium]